MIFISIAAPARPIKSPRRERERELFTFAILMTRFVFITSVIKDPLQVNMHNKNNNNTKHLKEQ